MVFRSNPIQLTHPDDEKGQTLASELTRVLGRITNLADFGLLYSSAGITVASGAAPGTAIVSSTLSVDFGDAGIDILRVVTYVTGDASNPVVNLNDITGSTVTLASVTAPAGTALQIGAWTRFTPSGTNQSIQLAVQGGGANVTLFNVHVQGATLQANL